MRQDKINYYLDVADSIANRGTCLRRNYGAVIVNNDEIVSTGYNGAPRGTTNCCDTGKCYRKEHNIPHGTQYEACKSVHAEGNAIISASRKEMIGADLYLVGFDVETNDYVKNANCCTLCKRMIINAGIKRVYVRIESPEYKVYQVADWIRDDKYMDIN